MVHDLPLPRSRRLVLPALALVLAAGCSYGQSSAGPSASPSAAGQVGAVNLPAPGPSTLSAPPAGTAAPLQQVQVQTQGKSTTIAFDFGGGGVPAYEVGYAQAPILDSQGNPVDILGSHVLLVHLIGAQPLLPHGELSLPSTPPVPDSQVTQLVRLDQGYDPKSMTFAAGLGNQLPFHVVALQDQGRLEVVVGPNAGSQ